MRNPSLSVCFPHLIFFTDGSDGRALRPCEGRSCWFGLLEEADHADPSQSLAQCQSFTANFIKRSYHRIVPALAPYFATLAPSHVGSALRTLYSFFIQNVFFCIDKRGRDDYTLTDPGAAVARRFSEDLKCFFGPSRTSGQAPSRSLRAGPSTDSGQALLHPLGYKCPMPHRGGIGTLWDIWDIWDIFYRKVAASGHPCSSVSIRG